MEESDAWEDAGGTQGGTGFGLKGMGEEGNKPREGPTAGWALHRLWKALYGV